MSLIITFSFSFYQFLINFASFVLLKICPFPYDLVKNELRKFKNAKICYAQEEHKNAGAYEFAKTRLESSLRSLNDERINQIR